MSTGCSYGGHVIHRCLLIHIYRASWYCIYYICTIYALSYFIEKGTFIFVGIYFELYILQRAVLLPEEKV